MTTHRGTSHHEEPEAQARDALHRSPALSKGGHRHHLTALAVIVALTSLASCGIQPKGAGAPRPSNAGNPPAGGDAEAWAFAPVRMRLHPLSRIARGQRANDRTVEAHVELLDRWGHGTRGLGTFVFELYRDTLSGDSANRGQEQINRWNLNLTDPDANARAFDRVTRTYRATLTGVAEAASRSSGLTLRATYRTADGRQLTASFRLDDGS